MYILHAYTYPYFSRILSGQYTDLFPQKKYFPFLEKRKKKIIMSNPNDTFKCPCI